MDVKALLNDKIPSRCRVVIHFYTETRFPIHQQCITTLFPATALATDTNYSIIYKTEPADVITAATYLIIHCIPAYTVHTHQEYTHRLSSYL